MKRLLFVVIVTSLFAVPAWGRQWTSRDGSFSVEAELLDVKDGNVLLIKQDGSQVSIPIKKLSLSDMRQIRDVLKAVETEIMGGEENAPLAAQSSIAPVTPPSDSQIPSVDLEKLNYGWKIGQTFVYQLQLVSRSESFLEELVGQVSYKVQAIQGDRVTLTSVAKLSPKYGNYAGVGRGYRRPPLFRALSGLANSPMKPITIDSLGQVIEKKTGPSSPFLLFNPMQLIFERLPAKKLASWTITSDKTIPLIDPNNPYYHSRPLRYYPGFPASEKIIYSVRGVTKKQIVLNKHYELKTAAELGGKPILELTGSGKLTFDTDQGVFSTLDLGLRLKIRSANITEEIPIQITYKLLNEEEIAKAVKEAADAKNKKEDAKKERKRPLTDDEINSVIAEIDSGDAYRVSTGISLLSRKTPSRPNPRVSRSLESIMLNDHNRHIQIKAAYAMRKWATTESVPALIKALDVRRTAVRESAIAALGRLKPKEAIGPIVQQLSEHMTWRSAANCLKSIGPDAEDAVLVFLEDKNAKHRGTACEVLGVIGTKKSIPALEKALLDDSSGVYNSARQALNAVKARQRGKAENIR